MRLINRNCYRKIGLIFSCCSLVVFFVILTQSQRSHIIKDETTTTPSKGDKSWEWSREKLNDFMDLLNKHKEKEKDSENNVFNFIHPKNTTNTTIDNKLHFPLLSKYLPYISDEESAMTPSYVLSKRPINKRGNCCLKY